MNLTDASDVATVLRAVYVEDDPDGADVIAAARRLAERTRKPLGSTGQPHVTPAQIRAGEGR